MTAYPDGFTLQEYDLAHAAVAHAQHDAHHAVAVLRERRIARIAAGAVGLVGATASFSALLAAAPPLDRVVPGGAYPFVVDALWPITLATAPVLLGLAAVAALGTYGLLRLGLRGLRRWRSVGSARLARAMTTSSLERLEAWSFGLPLVALALLAPLLLHAGVGAVSFALQRTATSDAQAVEDFAGWMRTSAVLVGHAHLALAVCAITFVRALRRMSTPELMAERAATRGWKHLAITTSVGGVPGVILILPPVLVFLTGALFVPLAYHVVRSVLLRERRAIERRDDTRLLPVGITELEAARASRV